MTYRTDDNAALLTDFLRWLTAEIVDSRLTSLIEGDQKLLVALYLHTVEPQWPAKDADPYK